MNVVVSWIQRLKDSESFMFCKILDRRKRTLLRSKTSPPPSQLMQVTIETLEEVNRPQNGKQGKNVAQLTHLLPWRSFSCEQPSDICHRSLLRCDVSTDISVRSLHLRSIL